MGQTTTWTRDSRMGNILPPGRFFSSGTWKDTNPYRFATGGFPLTSLKQTTTSYRSGSSELDVIAEEDRSDYTPTNRGEFARMLEKDRRDNARPYDTGHAFTSTNVTLEGENIANWRNPLGTVMYRGHFWPQMQNMPSGLGLSSFPAMPPEDLAFWGTAGIRQTKPTNPTASLATALAELKREGLPSLPGIQVLRDKGPAGFASEFLNVEFGFKPLANEIAKTMYAVSESGRILRQYQRDSGRIVRRRRVLDEQTTVKTYTMAFTGRGDSLSGIYTPGGTVLDKSSMFVASPQVLTETITQKRKYWFSAGYSYYLQDDNSRLNGLFEFEKKANHLLGLRITPEVLWELAPWSWLADWNANIGDNISNAVSLNSDGLVIRWAYIMCQTEQTRTVTSNGARLATGGTVSATCTWKTSSKKRIAATPFGFGLNPSSFTARQWAILAALGMTKSDRVLKQAS